ncbi:MAG TPA: hypothetical protein VNT56_02480, partial [Acidimicrobiales bacterium]|nr:hypothetical protein [Acidimicrobiales bacterium]
MRLGRRLPAAAVAMVLATSGLAPPAAAEPTVTWSRPTVEDAVLDQAGPIRGTIEGEENDRIERLEFELAAEPPGTGPGDPCVAEAPDAVVVYTDGNRSEDFEADIDFPCNRRYQLTAIVGYGDAGLANTVIPPDPVRATLNFSVAIPPAQVQGFEAAYDEASKEVRLSWAPNPERDLLGYMVERNPPGPEGFSRIGPDLVAPGETAFTDTGIDDEHRYRIVAVRQGPDSGSRLLGEPSAQAQAGPERTEPTLPDDLPAPNAR